MAENWSGLLAAPLLIWKIITADPIIFAVPVLFAILMVLMKIHKHKYKKWNYFFELRNH
jgi:hypothetical protein